MEPRCNSIIFYGKIELASNRRDEQEMSVLCLRICQAAIVYINVLMIQDVLADPDWDQRTHRRGRGGLTPLFWSPRTALRRGQTEHEPHPQHPDGRDLRHIVSGSSTDPPGWMRHSRIFAANQRGLTTDTCHVT